MVRIHKLTTFDTLTDEENDVSNSDKSKLAEIIHRHSGIRTVEAKRFQYKNGTDKEEKIVSLFESDVVRCAIEYNGAIIEKCPIIDEIVYLEKSSPYHDEILKQIIEDGLMFDGKQYIFYTATTGQVRDKTVTLIEQDFFQKYKDKLLLGLTHEYINSKGGMNVGKYLAYTALSLSSSIIDNEHPIDLDKCIVVKGLETNITDKVKFIGIQKDAGGQCYVADVPKGYVEKTIPIEHTDGAGMFLPGKLPSSCQIRGGFIKGAMFPFDFLRFAKEVAHNAVVTDAWGTKWDIEKDDIQFIFTTSQFKMWKMFDSWAEYVNKCKKYGIKLSINSYANPPQDKVSMAYQYLQTLPFGCDITTLCAAAKEDIVKLHTDFDYVCKEMGRSDETNDTDDETITLLNKSNSVIAEALQLYPQLINAHDIQAKVREFVVNKRRKYMSGKIPVKGYYSYVAPDMYAFCEYLFCGNDNPIGLIPKNCVYNKYYDDKGDVENVICLRSPHLSNYEYPKRKLEKSDKCREWFKYMESDTVVSCHDLISKFLQCDWDGDEILISADEELYKLIEGVPEVPLYYEMQTAKPQKTSNKTIYETLIKGFNNNVIGLSSNAIAKLWNAPKATETNPTPYDDAINIITAYSNYAIDYPKTGKNLDMGETTTVLYNKLIDAPSKNRKCPKNSERILLPSFFKEAKGKKHVAEPTNSVMDRIREFVGQGTGRLRYKYFHKTKEGQREEVGQFDYRILMNNETNDDGTAKYEVNRRTLYKKLYKVLKTRKNKLRFLAKKAKEEIAKQSLNNGNIRERFNTFYYYCIKEIEEIFTNKDGWFNKNLAVNYIIDMEYHQPDFIRGRKSILWNCFGDVILRNIKRHLKHSDVKIQYRPRGAYLKSDKFEQERAIADKVMAEDDKPKPLATKSVQITQYELESLQKLLKKRGKTDNFYKNDEELMFTLYCLYKYNRDNTDDKGKCKLKNGYFVINKRKHGGCSMNTVSNIAGTTTYRTSFERFNKTDAVEILEDNDNKYFKVKFDIPQIESETVIDVKDIYRTMVYYRNYHEGKTICTCKICRRAFIKDNNKPNSVTCSAKCSDALKRKQQKERNEKAKAKRVMRHFEKNHITTI